MKTSRRRFLAATPAAWLAAHWPAILEAQEHARHAAASPVPTAFQYLDAASAREIEAAAEQILPAGESAGARDAGVVYFIDRALATFDRDARGLYRSGLVQLERRARKAAGRSARFSELAVEKQISILKEIEKTEFFETLLRHTLIGFFCSPEHGGNRGGAGWRAIGFQDEPWFEPPFGTYDRNPEAK